MHQIWCGEVPEALAVGTEVVGVAGEGVGDPNCALKITVVSLKEGCEFTVEIDLGGRRLFGPIGAAAARAVKGDIERSIKKFEELYS